MKDRIPSYPGRVKLTPVPGSENTYDMVRADVPTQEGTPLVTATLLANSTAALKDLTTEATPNDMLAALARAVLAEAQRVQPLELGGTGATGLDEAKEVLGIANLPDFPLEVSQGGTGAENSLTALQNLGVRFSTTSLTPGQDMPEGVNLYFVYK